MKIKLISFGFNWGIPKEVSFIVDCRGILNPSRIRGLNALRGTDSIVMDRVLAAPATKHVLRYIQNTIKIRDEEGHEGVTIGVACSQGHHRSVAIVEEAARILRLNGHQVQILHRDINRREK